MNHPEAVLLPQTTDDSEQVLDQLCINALRILAMDAVQQANSGHPGLPLGAAPMAYVLWTRYLRHNPANPSWPNRDRFVLSAGYGSMLLYGLLYLTGYELSLDELTHFRQWGSHAPGHPERGVTPGVETTTGPLGQGFANGVGLAIAERFLAAHFNRPGYPLVDHYTYGLVSDGDLSWLRYTGERGAMLGIKRFVASAPGSEILRHYGFTVENVVTRALALLSTPSKGAVV